MEKKKNWWTYGYPLPNEEKRHRLYPWWKQGTVYGYEGAEGEGWVRSDGAGIVDEHHCGGYQPRYPSPTEQVAQRETYIEGCSGCTHMRGYHVPEADIEWDDVQRLPLEDLMELIDEKSPLKVPKPLAGQVWAEDEETSYLIVAVVHEVAFMMKVAVGGDHASSGVIQPVYVWPPKGMVLVDGPQSPWADTRKFVGETT